MDHYFVFKSLGYHGLEPSYILLLQVLYANQTGSIKESRSFSIQRGVKQGDILSSILFNCALDVVFEDWKSLLENEGLYVETMHDRLTNTRYADDILLYARSLNKLEHMISLLLIELQKSGLRPNFEKAKILHSSSADEGANYDHIDIDGNFIRVTHPEGYHRYLWRYLSLSSTKGVDIEFAHRLQQALGIFHKHRKVILNSHVGLKKRLKFSDACVTPVIIFALVVPPMTKQKLQKLDIIQRKMLRRIVGGRRVDGETWCETSIRMNNHLQHAQQQYNCRKWSSAYAQRQWDCVLHVLKVDSNSWARIVAKYTSAKKRPRCNL